MRTVLIAMALALMAPPASAVGADDEEPTGECHVKMNTDYAKVSINDEEYSGVEYENNGKKALIKNLHMDDFPIRVTMKPIYEELEEISFELVKEDFKRQRIGKAWVLVASKTLKFVKRKGAPKTPDKPAEPEKPAKPEKKPDAPDEL